MIVDITHTHCITLGHPSEIVLMQSRVAGYNVTKYPEAFSSCFVTHLEVIHERGRRDAVAQKLKRHENFGLRKYTIFSGNLVGGVCEKRVRYATDLDQTFCDTSGDSRKTRSK
jgi:hypothetical protein